MTGDEADGVGVGVGVGVGIGVRAEGRGTCGSCAGGGCPLIWAVATGADVATATGGDGDGDGGGSCRPNSREKKLMELLRPGQRADAPIKQLHDVKPQHAMAAPACLLQTRTAPHDLLPLT